MSWACNISLFLHYSAMPLKIKIFLQTLIWPPVVPLMLDLYSFCIYFSLLISISHLIVLLRRILKRTGAAIYCDTSWAQVDNERKFQVKFQMRPQPPTWHLALSPQVRKFRLAPLTFASRGGGNEFWKKLTSISCWNTEWTYGRRVFGFENCYCYDLFDMCARGGDNRRLMQWPGGAWVGGWIGFRDGDGATDEDVEMLGCFWLWSRCSVLILLCTLACVHSARYGVCNMPSTQEVTNAVIFHTRIIDLFIKTLYPILYCFFIKWKWLCVLVTYEW